MIHDRIPPTPEQPAADTRRAQRALLWGTVALLALVVLLTSLMSQQWDASWGEPGVRLMPRLSDPLVYVLGGLFIAGSIAVLAWEVEEARREAAWFGRPETRSAERTAWRRALYRFSGSWVPCT